MRSTPFFALSPAGYARLLCLLAACVSPLTIHTAQAQTYQILHQFAGPTGDGVNPSAILLGGNGTIFGTTCYGGLSYYGIAYQLSPAGKETVLYNFNAGYGSCPGAIFAWKGELYGVADGGAYRDGVIFKLDLRGNEIILNSFGPNNAAGIHPNLYFQNTAGRFYGSTFSGGLYGYGTLFTADTFGKVTVIYNFPMSTQYSPITALVQDENGNLYGAISGGGSSTCSSGCGTLFKLDAEGHFTTLYSFSGSDGAYPGSLIRDAEGNLYGFTFEGGIKCVLVSCGTVFKFDTAGNLTTLHSFSGGSDGLLPGGNLVRDAAGNLYGTTTEGGDLACADFINYGGCGTLFKIDPSGHETIVHTFTGPPGDAGTFGAVLLMNAAGDIYGASYSGGVANCNWISDEGIGCGTIFKLTP